MCKALVIQGIPSPNGYEDPYNKWTQGLVELRRLAEENAFEIPEPLASILRTGKVPLAALRGPREPQTPKRATKVYGVIRSPRTPGRPAYPREDVNVLIAWKVSYPHSVPDSRIADASTGRH